MKILSSLFLILFVQTIAFAQPITGTDVYLYEDADVKPHFKGGDIAFTRFLDSLAHHMPKGCDNVSSISFSFLVEKDGSISEASAQPLTEPVCEAFIVKHVLAMYKWTPGMEDGKPIRVLCGGYVRFREDDEPEPVSVIEISDQDMVEPPPPPPPFEGDNTPMPPEEEVSDTAVFTIVEQMPQFPGGADELMKFIQRSIKYPKNNEAAGTVFVEFIVEKDGSITNTKVLRSVAIPLDNEALRVVKALPKFIPGMQNGKPVRVKYIVPVKFTLR